MGAVSATTVLSHWNHLVPGLAQSSDEFYRTVESALTASKVDGLKSERIAMSEGGILSAKREYLQVRRKEHVFHICAAPFGTGFFVSWWLGEVRSGLFAELSSIPYVGWVFRFLANATRPLTYYRVDTALMFQSVTHGAVMETLDSVLSQKGLRALSEVERKPLMRDFFAQLASAGS